MRLLVVFITVFLSGVLLWDGMDVGWDIRRYVLLIHPAFAALVMIYVSVFYILPHIAYYRKNGEGTDRFHRISGMMLGGVLALNLLSGIGLMILGERHWMTENAMGSLHWWTSWGVMAGLALHAAGGRLVRTAMTFAAVCAVLVSVGSLRAAEPSDPSYQRGEKLFYSTKESGVPGLRMGDGTKSCATCHKKGFNETNRLLFDQSRNDPKRSAVIGHPTIRNFFAKDFVQDYLLAIIEQGGSVENIDDPSPDMMRAMGDLHLFIRSRQNLPFFSTWVRLDENTTHYPQKEWLNSASCQKCHPEIFAQWADSNHRMMGGSNPYYAVLEDLAAEDVGEGIRFWCMGCHSPTVLTSGGRLTSKRSEMFDRGGKGLVRRWKKGENKPEEGTSCLFCHRIMNIEEVRGNGGYTLNLLDRPRYLLESYRGVYGRLHEMMINAKPAVHADSYRNDLYRDSRYCMGCHTEFSPGKGSLIVDTYGEWERSPYNRGKGNPATVGCIDCHMNPLIGDVNGTKPGYSTLGGVRKQKVRTHHFAGSNHFLSGLRSPEHEAMTLQMLRSAAKISVHRDGNTVVVRTENVGAGHHLPTGVADFRELWLEVRIKDATGKTVLSSGILDENGFLGPESRIFRKIYGDGDGKPVGLKFWRYETLLEDTRIPAKGKRDERFVLPPDVAYPLHVQVKLRFRIYPQWVSTEVRKRFPALPLPPAITLHTVETRIP